MSFVHEQLSADGSSSFGHIVVAKAILDIIANDHIATLAVNNGGSGYVVGETFDLVGGTAVSGFIARGEVTSVSSGVVTGVRLVSAGAYSTLPGTTGAGTTNASGTGDDALTVDLTTAPTEWTVDRNTYVDDGTEFEWIATSDKAANPPTVGLQTAASGGDGAVRLLSASGFNAASLFGAQPNASPQSVYCNAPTVNPELYVSVTERRVNFLIRDGNFVQLGTIGLFIPFTDTDANYPLPLCSFGQTKQIHSFNENRTEDGASPENANTSVVHPNGLSANESNPYRYIDNLSTTWFYIARRAGVNGAEAAIYPHNQGHFSYGFSNAPEVNGRSTDPGDAAEPVIFMDGSPGGSEEGWFESGDDNQGVAPFGSNGRTSFLVDVHIIADKGTTVELTGILDGLRAVHGRGLTAFQDLEVEDGERYLVFPDTNTGEIADWIAMERV